MRIDRHNEEILKKVLEKRLCDPSLGAGRVLACCYHANVVSSSGATCRYLTKLSSRDTLKEPDTTQTILKQNIHPTRKCSVGQHILDTIHGDLPILDFFGTFFRELLTRLWEICSTT